jgi:hypothetical protein
VFRSTNIPSKLLHQILEQALKTENPKSYFPLFPDSNSALFIFLARGIGVFCCWGRGDLGGRSSIE